MRIAKLYFGIPILIVLIATWLKSAVLATLTKEFTLTVTNRSTTARSTTISYDVPQFTSGLGDPAGTPFISNIGTAAP